jgi:PPOX class probable F420-dependent enzyme
VRRYTLGEIPTEEVAMAAKLPDEVKALIDAPNFWHVSTVNPDGSPQSTVMWVDRRGERLMFNTAIGRVKQRNLALDTRVCVSGFDPAHPYSNVSIQGQVVETVEGDQALADIDALANKYMGVETYPFLAPGERRITYLVEPRTVWYRPPAAR